MSKNQILMLKLKGELSLNEINALEDLINAYKDQYNNIGFELSGLNYIDSSGIGFIIDQYKIALSEQKSVKFYFNNEIQSVIKSDDILNLCNKILNKKKSVEKDHIDEQKEQPDKNPDIEKQKNIETSTEKIPVIDIENSTQIEEPIILTSEQISPKTIVEKEVTVRPPIIERHKHLVSPIHKKRFIKGAILSLAIILSLFIPQIRNSKIIFGWSLLKMGISGLAIYAYILFGTILFLICITSKLSLYNRAPILLIIGITSVFLWFHYLSFDKIFYSTFNFLFTFKNLNYYLPAVLITSGTMFIFVGKGNRTKSSFIFTGIFIVSLILVYTMPIAKFNPNNIILTSVKKRIFFITLINGILRPENVKILLLNIFFLLPLLLSILNITVFIPSIKSGIFSRITGRFFISYIPILLLLLGIYSGFYKSIILFSHLIFLTINLIIFSFFFSIGINYTFGALSTLGPKSQKIIICSKKKKK